METTLCVFDVGRLVLMLAIITQGIIFSAHVAQEHKDPRYYASALIALPTLIMSWWYFARPPRQRADRPTLVWLVYALTVVAFQALSFGATDISTHDSALLYVANVFTPLLFLLCIVTGCERSVKDAGFVMASGMAILNAFDATDVIFSVARNERSISEGFRGGFVAMACGLLVWSALEFTVRTQLASNGVMPTTIACGLHAIHIALNAIVLAMRVVLYADGMIEFSAMIAKNAMVVIVRFVYMVSVMRRRSHPPAQPASPVLPSAPPPPPSIEDSNHFVRPPTPLPLRSTLQDERNTNRRQDEGLLYPSLPRRVHFEGDAREEQ